jgi:hypothetical protein
VKILFLRPISTIFAAEMKRIGAAWLLLSIYVSMQLLSGIHRHEVVASAAVDCMECAHHVHHSGHLAASVDHVDDCLLCQFLHLVYTVAAVTVLVPLIVSTESRRFFLNSRMTQEESSVFYTRGPPFVL